MCTSTGKCIEIKTIKDLLRYSQNYENEDCYRDDKNTIIVDLSPPLQESQAKNFNTFVNWEKGTKKDYESAPITMNY